MTDSFTDYPLATQLILRMKEMGRVTPTEVQRQLIPAALLGRDVLAVAPTGTGKTLAYLLPVVNAVLADKPRRRKGQRGELMLPTERLRALVLCPTRELAIQVAEECTQLMKGTVLSAGAVFGKSPAGPQIEMLMGGVDLVVGTPGRVRELIQGNHLHTGAIHHLVIDEADRMWDMGFEPQVSWILTTLPSSRQTIGVSATLPPAVQRSLAMVLRDPERVDAAPPNTLARTEVGAHCRFDVADSEKIPLLLERIVGGSRRGVAVFVRTRRRADWVSETLTRRGLKVSLLHGDIPQRRRSEALAQFAAGENSVLVATDVASRGLHIERARTVINYDVPLLPEEFIHRVGRAGHGGGRAESISFVSAADAERWTRIEKLVGVEVVQRVVLPSLSKWKTVQVGSVAPDDESRPMKGKLGLKPFKPFKPSKGPKSHKPGKARPFKAEPRADGTFKFPKKKSKRPGRAARAPISGKPGGGVRRPPSRSK
ncbi:MAG: DEAD/DEAH box helicase [Planctomycetota bacterium]|nr:DEAD/DEAH box helicase [Planctomycetota bacterium]